jgi:hypothetical protein
MKIPIKQKKQYKIVCLTMPNEMYSKVKEIAEENKISVSAVIKYFVQEKLNKA